MPSTLTRHGLTGVDGVLWIPLTSKPLTADIRSQQRFVNDTRALEQLERFFEPPALMPVTT